VPLSFIDKSTFHHLTRCVSHSVTHEPRHYSDHFPGKFGSVGCPKMKGFGVKFYGLDSLPDASQQKCKMAWGLKGTSVRYFSGHFPGESWSVGCPKMKGFGVKFYGLDSLPDASQQKCTMDFRPTSSTSNSWRGKDRFCLLRQPFSAKCRRLL